MLHRDAAVVYVPRKLVSGKVHSVLFSSSLESTRRTVINCCGVSRYTPAKRQQISRKLDRVNELNKTKRKIKEREKMYI